MFDPERSLHRKVYAQNFLQNPKTAADALALAGIQKADTALEIGPGEGIITRLLADTARKVIAVESDLKLAEKLRQKFRNQPHVSIVAGDFLTFELPREAYKVFANIPFNITNQIVKKLLQGAYSPLDAHLFTQKEAALRLCGLPQEQELSILTKPWFNYDIAREFRREDFVPMPKVEVVLLRIQRRADPLLEEAERNAYESFVRYAFRQQKKDLKANLEKIFTYEQWKRLARDLKFEIHTPTTELAIEKWIGLFRFLDRIDVAKKKLISG